jgi:hypothetical protein
MRTITGRLANPNDQPLVGASIKFTALESVPEGVTANTTYRVVTDSLGEFSVEILPGTYTVLITSRYVALETLTNLVVVEGPPVDLFTLAEFQAVGEDALQAIINDLLEGTAGGDGLSAYEVAVENGFIGTEVEWLESLVGDTGPQGPSGAAGTNGTNGTQGIQGEAGLSAYEIALDNGFVGTEAEWLDSLVGEQGPQGIQGIQGIQGPTGTAGTNATISSNSTVLDIRAMSQAAYDALTPKVSTTLYIVTA